MSEQFSNPEQALIERLRQAPQPELPAEARALIRARVLDAIDHPPVPMPRPALLRPVFVIAIVLIAGALIVSGILFVLSRQAQPDITPTAPATFTIPPPTVTSTVTSTATIEPTATPQATVTLTLTPTIIPTTSVGVISIVEGPVDSVVDDVITVYGTPVQIPPNATVTVGDVVRIETNSQSGTSQVIVIVTPTAVNAGGGSEVNTNPSSGEVWQDDGNCAHPPPDWAPANGWRRRCQGQDKGNNGNNGGNGNNGNNGKPKNNH